MRELGAGAERPRLLGVRRGRSGARRGRDLTGRAGPGRGLTGRSGVEPGPRPRVAGGLRIGDLGCAGVRTRTLPGSRTVVWGEHGVIVLPRPGRVQGGAAPVASGAGSGSRAGAPVGVRPSARVGVGVVANPGPIPRSVLARPDRVSEIVT